MDILNQFYNDEHTREAVKNFQLEQLNKLALTRIYEGGDVKGIADAKKIIEESFTELRERYEFKKEKPPQSAR